MPYDLRKFSGSQFLKFEDVADNPIEVTIVAVSLGKFGKLDLTFDTGDKFSLNATNTKVLMKAYGYSDGDLLGQRIRLLPGKTKYQGELQDSVVVEPVSPGKPKEERAAPPPTNSDGDNEMNDEIPF